MPLFFKSAGQTIGEGYAVFIPRKGRRLQLPEPPAHVKSWAAGDAWLGLALVLAGAALGSAGAALGVLGTAGWGLLAALFVGALLNAGIVVGALSLRRRREERDALREQWLRELRHLAAWGSEEGILRKAGLLHDLSTLKADGMALRQMRLSGADLRGCHFASADLRGADLKGADLQGAVLDRADLAGADLTDANLSMASLRGASLRGCSLEGATLAKAEVEGAILVRANLVNANVYGVDFSGAVLERTRFGLREAGDFAAQVHPSVEDWIRERLDARGFYTNSAANPAPQGESQAGGESREDLPGR